jgi:hypothetical protein
MRQWVGALIGNTLYNLAPYEEIGIHPLADGSGYEIVATRRARTEESRITLATASELELLREKICLANLKKM